MYPKKLPTLLKLQEFIRKHSVMTVENIRNDINNLEEDYLYLLSILQKEQKNCISTTFIMHLLKQNRKQESLLQIQQNAAIKVLFQNTRRCEILQKKKKEEEDTQGRKKMAELLESYIHYN